MVNALVFRRFHQTNDTGGCRTLEKLDSSLSPATQKIIGHIGTPDFNRVIESNIHDVACAKSAPIFAELLTGIYKKSGEAALDTAVAALNKPARESKQRIDREDNVHDESSVAFAKLLLGVAKNTDYDSVPLVKIISSIIDMDLLGKSYANIERPPKCFADIGCYFMGGNYAEPLKQLAEYAQKQKSPELVLKAASAYIWVFNIMKSKPDPEFGRGWYIDVLTNLRDGIARNTLTEKRIDEIVHPLSRAIWADAD